jgi:hypothetical protein
VAVAEVGGEEGLSGGQVDGDDAGERGVTADKSDAGGGGGFGGDEVATGEEVAEEVAAVVVSMENVVVVR